MPSALSHPARDEHISACGLFCTNCGAFKKEKCAGCQEAPRFASCKIRICCEKKKITTCAECPDFAFPRDYRECPKVYNFMGRLFGFIFGTNRTAALVMLRDQGKEAYLTTKRESGKM
jgi:hypothetical protein